MTVPAERLAAHLSCRGWSAVNSLTLSETRQAVEELVTLRAEIARLTAEPCSHECTGCCPEDCGSCA